MFGLEVMNFFYDSERTDIKVFLHLTLIKRDLLNVVLRKMFK